MKKHIPNILTLANLFCGCLAIFLLNYVIFINSDSLKPGWVELLGFNWIDIVSFLVFLSLVFDFGDGLVARMLNVKSKLGAELDSLADMVTFGVLPGFIMFYLLNTITPFVSDGFNFISFLGLLITLFSALRLAKFNIDETQNENFKGLAVPANTIFILSLALAKIYAPESFMTSILNNTIFLIVVTIISSFLLVSNIPMFSFKMKNFSFSDNIHRYLLVIISVILLAIFQIVALPLIIILYIILSIIFKNKFA